MTVRVDSCGTCGELTLAAGTGFISRVPGTGRMDCVHRPETIGFVRPDQLAHVALSTVLRSVPALSTQADMCHVLQDWLGVPNWADRNGMPSRLLADYGVSSEGLAAARVLARWMSRLSGTDRDVLYWQAATNVLRIRL